MNIEAVKINLAKQLFSIEKPSVLERIQAILEKEEIVAYSSDGKALTREAYIKSIEKAEKEIENGETLTQEELLEQIKKW